MIGILNGILGEAALAEPFAKWLITMGMTVSLASMLSTLIIVVVITYSSIVVGELVPKRLAQFHAEPIALMMSGPITLLATISRPFVWLLSFSTNGILRLLGRSKSDSANITEDDIHAQLHEASLAGVIDQSEHHMLRNVMQFDDRKMASIMTPRHEIEFLDVNLPIEENIKRMMRSDYHRFPVCRGGMQEILGITSAKRLLHLMADKDGQGYKDLLKSLEPPMYVAENNTAGQVLNHLRQHQAEMICVVDEYGDVQGIVTDADLFEAVVGELYCDDQDDLWLLADGESQWIMDGLIPMAVVKETLSLKQLPDEHEGGYHTLNGMLIWTQAGLPQLGDCFDWEGWRFEVTLLDGNRAGKVRVYRHDSQSA